MFPMFVPPFMGTGALPGVQGGPLPFAPMDPTMTGAVPTDEAKRQFTRIFLTAQKEQVARALKANAEYQKNLEEAMSAIDKQLSKLDEDEVQTKKTSSSSTKQTSK